MTPAHHLPLSPEQRNAGSAFALLSIALGCLIHLLGALLSGEWQRPCTINNAVIWPAYALTLGLMLPLALSQGRLRLITERLSAAERGEWQAMLPAPLPASPRMARIACGYIAGTGLVTGQQVAVLLGKAAHWPYYLTMPQPSGVALGVVLVAALGFVLYREDGLNTTP